MHGTRTAYARYGLVYRVHVVVLVSIWSWSVLLALFTRELRKLSGVKNAENVLSFAYSTSHYTKQRDMQCAGKEEILSILMSAGVVNATFLCQSLPTWNEVSALYGAKPVILGLHRCEEYQENLRRRNVSEPQPRIAGLYNTGTNALVRLLELNFKPRSSKSYFAYDVAWGKHLYLPILTDPRWNVTRIRDRSNISNADILPIAVIKDPFWWMNSMCRTRYGMRWKHTAGHCPNLVPTARDRRVFPTLNESFHVEVRYERRSLEGKGMKSRFSFTAPSLVHAYDLWYRQYLNLDRPRLIVRFEDILFHKSAVVDAILKCIGRPRRKPFVYLLEKSKTHGKSNVDFVAAITKYGSETGRTDGMTPDDLTYAKRHLSADFLNAFQYTLPLSFAKN